jgi:hypothetical protein
MKKSSVFLVIFALYLANAFGQGNLNTTRIGVWPYGWGNTVACYEEHVFLSYGRVIQVYDYGDPQQPQLKGEVFMDDMIGALAFQNGIAYAAGYTGFFILDVANPELPVIISSLNISSMAYAVSVSGNFAYLALYEGEIMIIDISDTQNPVTVAIHEMQHPTNDIVMMDGLAWIAAGSSGIIAYDLSDPQIPMLIYHYPSSGIMRSLAFEDELLFAFNKDLGLMIFDITSLPAFNLLSTTYLYGNGTAISIENDVIAVTLNWTGFAVYDISNPSAPDSLGMFYADMPNRKVVLKDGYAFHCNGSDFNIFDLNTPDEMTLLASVGLSDISQYVHYWENHLYISSSIGSVMAVDVTNPEQAVKVAQIDGSDGHHTIHVKDDLLFTNNYQWLKVYDVSLPSEPVYLNTLETTTTITSVLKLNQLLFVSDYDSLQVFNISDIYNPELLGVYPYEGIQEMTAKNQYLYCVKNSGFIIIDFSDPTNLNLLSSIENMATTSMAVKDTLAYVVSSNYSSMAEHSLKVFNIKNPSSVFLETSSDQGRQFENVVLDGDYVYVFETSVGLQIYDTQEIYPVLCGFYSIDRTTVKIATANGVSYLPAFAGVDIVQNDLITSTENIFIEHGERLNLFPNPANNQINFELEADNHTGIYTYEIFQINGAGNKSGKLTAGQNQISLNGLPAGVFLLQILKTGEKYKRGLFVKQ